MPTPEPTKPLGNPRGSINSPIAAFGMALILGIYCITSIRSARRDAEAAPPTSTSQPRTLQSYRERANVKYEQPAWMQQALEQEKKSRDGAK